MLWWEAAGSVVSADVTSTAGASVMQSYRPAVQSHLGVFAACQAVSVCMSDVGCSCDGSLWWAL
jgi:hypothetical protein